MTETIRFSESLTIRLQPEVTMLLSEAARARGSKPSECARQALIMWLRLNAAEPLTFGTDQAVA